jgi:hypothetical protein
MIDPAKYRKAKGKKSGLMVNIRLQRRGAKPSKTEVIDALTYILANERTPSGWRLAFINWRRPKSASAHWQSGRLNAFNDLAPVIQAALHSARVSIVRRGKGKR